ARPKLELGLEPVDDLGVLREALGLCQVDELLRGRARLGLDVVEICLKGHRGLHPAIVGGGARQRSRMRAGPCYLFDVDRKYAAFRLGTADLSLIRFAISPGNELAHAVRVLQAQGQYPLQWG